jgi:CDP-diglyceride synthetase
MVMILPAPAHLPGSPNQKTAEEERMFDTSLLPFVPIFLIVIILVVSLAAMIPWFFIYKKAGFHPAMGCLMFFPIVNLVMMFILAFTDWPIERELQNLRTSVPDRNEVRPNI